MLAHQVALSMDACLKCCEQARRNVTVLNVKRDQPRIKFYDDDHGVFLHAEKVAKLAFGFGKTKDQIRSLDRIERKAARMLDRWNYLGRISLVDYNKLKTIGWEWADEMYSGHLKEIREEIAQTAQTPSRIKVEELLNNPESEFLFGVWIPCMIEYGISFGALLRRATEGKLDESKIAAIEMLFRLDKYCINYPPISQILSEILVSKETAMIKRLQDALAGEPEPRRQLSRTRLKICFGAYLLMVSRVYNEAGRRWEKELKKLGISDKYKCFRLTAPDIRRLFDSVSKDFGSGLKDSDLSDHDIPHTFATALRRDAAIWAEYEKPSHQLSSACEGIDLSNFLCCQSSWLNNARYMSEKSSWKPKGTSSS